MINAWSLLYDEINGTLDENFPIKKDKMNDDIKIETSKDEGVVNCLLYTSPSPRDRQKSRMPSSA